MRLDDLPWCRRLDQQIVHVEWYGHAVNQKLGVRRSS